jgi:excisionase family DNA binding protein
MPDAHKRKDEGPVTPRASTPTRSTQVDESKMMTLAEVAKYLHCHYSTAFRLVHSGGLPGFTLGSDWRFLRSEVDKWIAQRQVTPAEKATAKPDRRGRKRKSKPRSR